MANRKLEIAENDDQISVKPEKQRRESKNPEKQSPGAKERERERGALINFNLALTIWR